MNFMSDMNEEILTPITSHLAPPDVFALAMTSKRTFWSDRAHPLGVRLTRLALRRHLEGLVSDVTSRDARAHNGRTFTLDDLFPEDERAKRRREEEQLATPMNVE